MHIYRVDLGVMKMKEELHSSQYSQTEALLLDAV